MNVTYLFTTAIGIIGIAGGIAGYFGKSRGDSIITYQATEISLRDSTIKRLEAEVVSLESENRLLREQNKTLKGLAQGSPELVKLTAEIKALTVAVVKGMSLNKKKT